MGWFPRHLDGAGNMTLLARRNRLKNETKIPTYIPHFGGNQGMLPWSKYIIDTK
jgi:hypothetical protein